MQCRIPCASCVTLGLKITLTFITFFNKLMSNGSKSLTKYAWLSIAAAIATIALKSYAYWLTDSVGLLSDALESLINLVAAIIMLVVLNI